MYNFDAMKARAIKREVKKQVMIMLKPSTKKKSKAKAEREGKSLSEVAESLLFDYSAE